MIDAASAELRERVGKLLSASACPPPMRRLRWTLRDALRSSHRDSRVAGGFDRAGYGTALTVAYKDGQPHKPRIICQKHGLDVNQLGKTTTPKGEYLAATVTKKGRTPPRFW